MINNDVLSSQAANRQRRHAADERARIDRIVTDTAVREGVARQAGEAPSREEITQFRNLMRSQGREDRPLDTGKRSAQDTRSPAAAGSARFAGELAGMSTAERFRTLMQQAFAQVGEREAEPAQSEQPVLPKEARQPSQEGMPEAPKPETQASDTARGVADAQTRRPPEAADAKPAAGADQAKPDETAEAPGAKRGETKSKAGNGEAESAQQAARKAADGEAQVGQAARLAQGDDDTEDGEGTGAASSQAGGGMPTPMSVEMAPMPSSPQAMPAEMAQQAAASGSLAPALSELVQKHVKQMLVSDPRSLRGRSREVLLRMQNDVLPGTDLWLTQTDDGWQLRADVRSRDAYDTLLANQDELVQRFADSALGTLTIEPVFHS